MDITYTVHSCSQDEVAVTATVAGKEVEAKVSGLIVELVSDDGGMGHTFRLMPDDMAASEAFFKVGDTVVLTFSKPSVKAGV